MKGLKKCYGVLSLFAIIFGFSLNVCSDTNALQYALDSVYLPQRYAVDPYSGNTYISSSNSSFSFTFNGDIHSDFRDDYTATSSNGSYSGSWKRNYSYNNPCSDFNFGQIFSHNYTGSNGGSVTHFYSGNGTGFKVRLPALCQYGLTYSYAYNNFYTSSVNLSTGVPFKTIEFYDLLFPSSFSDTLDVSEISLTYALKDDITSLADVPFSFSVGFSTNSSSGFSYFNDSVKLDYIIKYFDDNGDPQSVSLNNSSCSLDSDYVTHIRNDELYRDRSGFNFICSYTPSTSMRVITINMRLYGPTNSYYNVPFLTISRTNGDMDSSGGLYFNGSYVITDNDSTWSGQLANLPESGLDSLDNNPSHVQLFGLGSSSGCSEGDFFCNLSNLFNFNFSNPFAPIFAMFDPGSNCAQIPTLAGMLHSEETQVCSFFSDNTRAILTPVFTIASMMIIFGFTVRWLGARSGNLFEDSFPDEGIVRTKGITTDNYHFSNKFRRRK